MPEDSRQPTPTKPKPTQTKPRQPTTESLANSQFSTMETELTGFKTKDAEKPVDYSALWSDAGNLRPRLVQSEREVTPAKKEAAWKAAYDMARATDEPLKKQVRLATYIYHWKNGCSKENKYTTSIVTSGGLVFNPGVIVSVVGEDIRKFMVSNARDSYYALKNAKLNEDPANDDHIAKLAGRGVSPEFAWATADWLTNYAGLLPAERDAHEINRRRALMEANVSRRGRTLDEVREERVESELGGVQHTTAPAAPSGSSVW